MSNSPKEQKAVFVNAIRTSKHHVDVTYKLPETGDNFTVCWCNIHPETGNTESAYDLDVIVQSDNEDLAYRVSEAIKGGESDDNPDVDLYLTVRDDFDRLQVESLEDLRTVFDVTYYSSQKHSSSNMSEYTRHNLDVFNEVNGLYAVYQNGNDYYHGDYSLPSTDVELSTDGGTADALLKINDLDEDSFDMINEDFIKDLGCEHIKTKADVIETYWVLKYNNAQALKVGEAYEPDDIKWPVDEH